MDVKCPGYKVLCVARPRLDVCAKLANREIAKNKQHFRYLAFDASPQHRGREVCCTVEHRIDCSAIESDDIRATVVQVRRLPICAMGQGRFLLAHKSCMFGAPDVA